MLQAACFVDVRSRRALTDLVAELVEKWSALEKGFQAVGNCELKELVECLDSMGGF